MERLPPMTCKETTMTEILTATAAQVDPCLPILADSILGTYFDPPLARSLLAAAQKQKQLMVAVDDGEVAGFAVVVPKGGFLVFPYLHLLAVKTDRRGRGLGGLLLAHLEAKALASRGWPERPKVFLLVSDENPVAVRFYEAHGYRRLAAIEDMFGEGDTEYLYMKDLGRKPRP